ncbi:MAG: IS21 family transposase, partial [Magnetococcales bacterium]|nr:IS21 family transposase [Magnetococcales bacterium]
MLTLETRAKIRRDRKVHHKSIKQISRERGVSRNTVRKALKSGPEAFVYQRSHQPRPQLGPFIERLEQILEEDWPRQRKKRLAAKLIYEDLVREGYQGAYDSVRRFVKAWRDEKGHNPGTVFVPLYFEPGSVYQFDWSYESAVLG